MPGRSKSRADYERLAKRVGDYGHHRTEEFMTRQVAKDAEQAILDLCLMVWGAQITFEEIETGDKT